LILWVFWRPFDTATIRLWMSLIYPGVEPVPVHAGRWWEVGSTPFEGARIKEWRPHWSILHKSHAEDIALYGSEEEKWKHNPILHPVQGETSFFL
jgi:hypothetical protein